MPLIPSETSVTQDDALLIEGAREFARIELLALDRAWDQDESSVVEVLPKLAEMGFLNLLGPQEFGGLGISYRAYAAILHELARWSPSTCVTVAVHNMVVRILDHRARGEARERWLSSWGSEESFGAFAISEAGAGSDTKAIKTQAVEVDGGFRVQGEKMWVTNGMSARWLLTLTRLKESRDKEPWCALMIDGHSPGIERTKIKGKMGIRGSETAVIHLNDVFVPDGHLLGQRGQGLEVCLEGLNGGRIGIAAQATGIAEACLEEMIRYAKTREQFGRPIGAFQAVAEMIAVSAVELDAAKLLVWRAATQADADNLERTASSMAKLFASECANQIAYRAVQVHGGTGYVNECRVEQLYRDARITSIYEGTSEVQRFVIARELGRT